jgi:hypothetical protein
MIENICNQIGNEQTVFYGSMKFTLPKCATQQMMIGAFIAWPKK